MDEFMLSTQQQQQKSSLMHPNSLDEFPALPRAQNGGHLDLSQPEGQQHSRNAFLSGGMGGILGQPHQQGQQAQAQVQARQPQPSTGLRQSVLSLANMQNGTLTQLPWDF